MTRHVVGVFPDAHAAHTAVESLLRWGISDDRISVLNWEDPDHGDELIEYDQEERAEAINAGLWSGGAMGGIVGLLAGAASVIAAPIGVVAVIGSLSSAVGAATIGATVGGFAGSVMKLGWAKHDAEELLERMENGAVVVAVTVPTAQVTELTEKMTTLGPEVLKVL